MIALSDSQLQAIWGAADGLQIEKRGIFLVRFVAQLKLRGSHFTTANLDDAVRLAFRHTGHCDLRHRPQFRTLLTKPSGAAPLPLGVGAMDNDAEGLAEFGEDILTFDVPDDALERSAAVSEGQAAHTIGYCTHWYHCNWPL